MKTLKFMAFGALMALASTSAFGADANSNSTSGSTSGAVQGQSMGSMGANNSQGQSANNSQGQSMGANNAQGQSANNDQGQGQSMSIDSHNVSRASDMGDMVGAAFAPALTTTLTETCMGSTSIGAGWSGGGVSFGTTWRDSACVRRLDAREIKTIHKNFAIVAKEIMCDSDHVYEAFKRAGIPCVVQEDKEDAKPKAETASRGAPAKSVSTDVASQGNGFF